MASPCLVARRRLSKPFRLQVIIYAIGVLLTAAFFYTASLVNFSDSEIWGISLAKTFPSPNDPSTIYKLVFSGLLRTLYFFELGNWQTLLAARFLFAALAIASVGFFYQIAMLLFESRRLALWCVLLLIANTFFWSQGFRVRSDLLALFWGLWFLRSYLKLSQPELNDWRKSIRLMPLLLLMLLSTPKALVLFVLIGVTCYLHLRNLRKQGQVIGLKPAGLPFVLLPLCGLAVLIYRWQDFMTAAQHLLGSYTGGPHQPSFLSPEAFHYVLRFGRENWPLIGLILLGCWQFRRSIKNNQSIGLSPLIYLSILAILIYPSRLPFFILSILPFLILGLLSQWQERFSKDSQKGPQVVLAIVLMLNCAYYFYQLIENGNNFVQREALHKIESYLKQNPGVRYYDGLALLPRDNQIYAWPAPEHAYNHYQVMISLKDPKLDFVFLSQRHFGYLSDFLQILEEEFFIEVAPGIFQRARVRSIESQKELGPQDFKKICEELNTNDQLWTYQGFSFLKLQALSGEYKSLDCKMLDGIPLTSSWQISSPYLAFTRFPPPQWNLNKSFAEIFDHNPFY